MTGKQASYSTGYWAFRLGRLVIRLSREIESAYLVGSCPLGGVSRDPEDHPHVRDEFAVLDQTLQSIDEALDGLQKGRQSNLAQAAKDAKEAFTKVIDQVTEGLSNGDAAQLAQHFSDIQELSREFQDEAYEDRPINKFLAQFRGEATSSTPTKRGRGRPRKEIPKQDEIPSPLALDAWKKFTKCVDKLVSRLGDASAFFNFGSTFERGCETYRIKESAEAVGQSWNEVSRNLARDIEKQLSQLSDAGVRSADLEWDSQQRLDIETYVRKTADEIEERLKTFGGKNRQRSLVITALASLPDLCWKEVTIEVRSPDETGFEIDSITVVFIARRIRVERTLQELGFLKPGGQPKKIVKTLMLFAKHQGAIKWPKVRAIEKRGRKKLEDEENPGEINLYEAENKNEEDPIDEETQMKDEDDFETGNFAKQTSLAPPKPIVTKEDVSKLRKQLEILFGTDSDPFKPYQRSSRKRKNSEESKGGYQLKCDCILIISPRNSVQ